MQISDRKVYGFGKRCISFFLKLSFSLSSLKKTSLLSALTRSVCWFNCLLACYILSQTSLMSFSPQTEFHANHLLHLFLMPMRLHQKSCQGCEYVPFLTSRSCKQPSVELFTCLSVYLLLGGFR